MQTTQTKKDRSRLVPLTYPTKMIAKEYQNLIQNELNYATYLFLTLLVASLQVLKQVKLERLAEALPLPILFESRRKKLQRFLKLEVLNIETLWFPCVATLLDEFFTPGERLYVAIDRTSWGCINILVVICK